MRGYWLSICVFGWFSLACGSEDPAPGPRPPTPRMPEPTAPEHFESDLPGMPGLQGPAGPGPVIDPNFGAPESTILEADVVQRHGDRLYALSSISGLTVIDVSDPDRLRLLGRHRNLPGQPFEMYVRGDTLLLLSRDYRLTAPQPGGLARAIGHVIALDVADPAAPERLSEVEVPGALLHSRIVGDVLYLVSDELTTTSITALSLAEPRAIRRIAEHSLFDDGTRASATLTDQRIYLALGSRVHVIDLTDPRSALVAGAVIEIAGQISSRFQLDESAGVLRVFSQATGAPAVLQTFRVISAQELQPLGRLTVPAQAQSLRFARFDGPRAYISTDRDAPPYAIDLADAAEPKLLGRLEFPGTIEFVEPRGDRVLAFGARYSEPGSPQFLALFDVHDLAAPKLLSSASFGPGGASGSMDWSFVHEQLRIEEGAGLVLLPVAGIDFGPDSKCFGRARHGVQLFELDREQLRLRGALATLGAPRRALLVRDRVLTVSDLQIASFDIEDRQAPEPRASLNIAKYVQRTAQLPNGVVARVVDAHADSFVEFEFVPNAGAADLNQRSGGLVLVDLISQDPATTCALMNRVESLHADGSRLYVLYEAYYDSNGNIGEARLGVLVIDVADPSEPKLLAKNEWGADDLRVDRFDSLDYASLGQEMYVWRGTTLTLIEREWPDMPGTVRLRVMDFRDPAAPTTQLLPLADDVYTRLSIAGDTILASRYHELATGRAEFYLDRFDISDPAAPRALPPINVPGALLHYEAQSQRALTLAFRNGEGVLLQLSRLEGDGARLEGTYEIEDEDGYLLRSYAGGSGVWFATLGRGLQAGGICPRPCTGAGLAPEPARVLLLSGLRSGRLQEGWLDVGDEHNDWVGYWQTPAVVAHGTRALLYGRSTFAVIDASDAAHPELGRSEQLEDEWISHVSAREDRALLTIGFSDARWVDM